MPETSFDPSSLGNLSDRTIVITGANTGIGFEAARLLARAGARIALACRDPARAESAAARLRESGPKARVDLVALDLADLESIRKAAGTILERVPAIDVLINNAGVMALPRRTTRDGFEMQLATNHLGHFALTGLLMPAIVAAPAARVVNVSSGLHKRGRVDFDDLQGERSYDKWKAYSQSKLCNLLFAYELERRLRAAGTRAISLACHPGYAATELQGRGPSMEGSKILGAIMNLGNALLAQSAEAGAWPTVFAAVSPEARGMDYVGPLGLAHMRGRPGRDRSTRRSHDEADARRLWEISERLTGVSYDLLRARAAS
jgi:NAD(P)-dependent dehydrogenase (short-subunit alcohol dehydrogenase family)